MGSERQVTCERYLFIACSSNIHAINAGKTEAAGQETRSVLGAVLGGGQSQERWACHQFWAAEAKSKKKVLYQSHCQPKWGKLTGGGTWPAKGTRMDATFFFVIRKPDLSLSGL